MPKRFNRYDHRCDYCGRFMPWSWVSAWNCFAGYSNAWCQRLACGRAADQDAGRRVLTVDLPGISR